MSQKPWDYSLVGLSEISKKGVSAISSTVKELEQMPL